LRLALLFILSELLLGGLVYFAYGLLDKYLLELIGDVDSGAENRRALIFSVIILFAIGALKLLIMILSGSKDEKSVTLSIKIGDKSCTTEALVDTGNLVKDPMSMCPVVFLKKSFAGHIFPTAVLNLERLDTLPQDYRRRIRLIPVTRNGETHVITGVRADLVEISSGSETVSVDMTVAIDREEGSFGGYFALVPSAFN
jgi:stage II sporulation protein GA (sporulation sigma-E factor processing peptidase)